MRVTVSRLRLMEDAMSSCDKSTSPPSERSAWNSRNPAKRASIVSALAGAVSAFLLKMPNNSLGAGMGTSGLVGQFGALASMEGSYPLLSSLGLILLMHFIFPAVLVGAISWFFRRRGWFKPGDMKLTLR